MKEGILFSLRVLWQLPQAVAGAALYLWYAPGAGRVRRVGTVQAVFNRRFPGGISLWPFVFLDREDPQELAHEIGHTVQSLRWGWLYLPVVGLTSVFHLLCRRRGLFWSCHSDYYSVWPENEADRLGRVRRG